jgi:hypothetical protein
MSGCLIAVIGLLLSSPANCHSVAHMPNILQRIPLKRPCKAGCSTRETLLAYLALPVQKDYMPKTRSISGRHSAALSASCSEHEHCRLLGSSSKTASSVSVVTLVSPPFIRGCCIDECGKTPRYAAPLAPNSFHLRKQADSQEYENGWHMQDA